MIGRSRGSYLLARCGKTATEIARESGVSVVSVTRWISGEKRPSADRRAHLERLIGIEAKAWDEPQKTSAPNRGKPTAPSTDAAVEAKIVQPAKGAIGLAIELERKALTMIQGLDEDEGTTPLERARLMGSIAQTLSLLARLTGEFDKGRMFMASAMWQRIVQAHREALRPYPEAAKALSEALRAADAEFEF